MRGENGFLLTAEKIGRLGGDTAEHLVGGVDDPPAALDFVGFR
jgi:hypothetical protein